MRVALVPVRIRLMISCSGSEGVVGSSSIGSASTCLDVDLLVGFLGRPISVRSIILPGEVSDVFSVGDCGVGGL